MMESRSQKLWAIVGKVSAILVILTMIIGIYKTLFPSNVELAITGQYNTFALPPDMNQDIETLREMTSWFFLNTFLSESFEDEKAELRIRISDIASRFADSLQTAIGDNSFPSYRSFVSLLIKNEGDKKASDIVLGLPISGVALITEDDENQRTVEFKKSLRLNDLRARSEMHVAIWSDEIRISRYQEPDFKLTHGGGVESISFGSSVFGFKKWVAEYLYIILILSLLIIGVACLIYAAVVSESQEPRSEKENDQTEKKTATQTETSEVHSTQKSIESVKDIQESKESRKDP